MRPIAFTPSVLSQKALVQPKLAIHAPGDRYEREADAMADRVMRSLVQSGALRLNQEQVDLAIQRKCAACEEEEQQKPLMRKAEGSGGLEASPGLVSQLGVTQGSGSPLPAGTRNFMENAFSTDFSRVRIHSDGQAAAISRGIQAKAFTHGSDIYFNQGQYSPHTQEGQRLLAHELTHTVQQGGKPANAVQRQTQTTLFGPASSGAPADWSTQVAQATTSAQKAALIQTALGSSVTVVDRTTQSSTDPAPNPAHLMPYTASTPTVNFDENLQSKRAVAGGRSLQNNAGYSLFSNGRIYVILSSAALSGNDFYDTITALNHEMDHIRQHLAGSTLTGNASELDAWTSTFIREFHRSYVLGNRGSTCYVHQINEFAPLLMYYSSVSSATEKSRAVQRISTYYTSVMAPHAAHQHVFRFWIHRTLKRSRNPDLAADLNSGLSLNITASDSLTTTRQFNCTGLTSLTYPAPPSASLPTFPTAAPAGSGSARGGSR
jgi:hypothetical protein